MFNQVEVEAYQEMKKMEAQRDAALAALQALYNASPTSCEDKALIDAQKLAEKVLGISR
jgi:hypothetical protein